MCRNIKPLFNFEPPASRNEIHDAALQFVRKISGYNAPSKANEAAFHQAVEDIDGELAAYRDGALFQLAGVAATNGSEIALTKSAVSAALANLNSMYPRRSTSSRGA